MWMINSWCLYPPCWIRRVTLDSLRSESYWTRRSSYELSRWWSSCSMFPWRACKSTALEHLLWIWNYKCKQPPKWKQLIIVIVIVITIIIKDKHINKEETNLSYWSSCRLRTDTRLSCEVWFETIREVWGTRRPLLLWSWDLWDLLRSIVVEVSHWLFGSSTRSQKIDCIHLLCLLLLLLLRGDVWWRSSAQRWLWWR